MYAHTGSSPPLSSPLPLFLVMSLRAALHERLVHRPLLIWKHHGLWFRMQWALKYALLACLPAILLVRSDSTSDEFTPPVMVISFIIVTTAGTFGQGVAGCLIGVKIALISYVAVTIIESIDVGRHWALWGAVLAVGTLMIAITTDFLVTINSMLMFLIGMAYNYNNHNDATGYGGRSRLMYSSYQVRDVLLGVGLGLISSIFPFRSDEFIAARSLSDAIVEDLHLMLHKMLDAFAADTNAQRTALMMVVRRQRRVLEDKLVKMQGHINFAWYEPVWGLHVMELQVRRDLFVSLTKRLHCVAGLVETLREKCVGAESAIRLSMLKSSPRMADVRSAAAVLCDAIVQLSRRRMEPCDRDAVIAASAALLRTYEGAHETRVALTDSITSDPLSASVEPLLEFVSTPPMPCIGGSAGADVDMFTTAVSGYLIYELNCMLRDVTAFEEPIVWTTPRRISNLISWPLRELRQTWAELVGVFKGTPAGIQRLIFAVRLALALTTFNAYILNHNVGDPFFGPAQMAIAAGLDSSRAVMVFGSLVVGSVLGTTTGYMVSTACHTLLDYAIAVTVLALVTGFFRSSPDYSLVVIYIQFNLFGALRDWSSPEAALNAVLTNTAAMSCYVALQLLFLPANPMGLLKIEMRAALVHVGEALQRCHVVLLQQNRSLDPHTSLPVQGDSPTDPLGPCRACVAAIARQTDLLPSAALQPRLSMGSFPTPLVEKMIERERVLLSIVEPLTASWQQMIDEGLEFKAPGLAAAVGAVSEAAEGIMQHMTHLFDDDSSSHIDDHDASIRVFNTGAAFHDLSDASGALIREFSATFGVASEARASRNHFGLGSGPSPRDIHEPFEHEPGTPLIAAAVPLPSNHLLDTVLYCCEVLPETLLELFRCVSDVHAATHLL